MSTDLPDDAGASFGGGDSCLPKLATTRHALDQFQRALRLAPGNR